MDISWFINLKFVYYVMSLEELIFEAYRKGLRKKLFKKVTKMRKKLELEGKGYHLADLYDKAYSRLLKKQKNKNVKS